MDPHFKERGPCQERQTKFLFLFRCQTNILLLLFFFERRQIILRAKLFVKSVTQLIDEKFCKNNEFLCQLISYGIGQDKSCLVRIEVSRIFRIFYGFIIILSIYCLINTNVSDYTLYIFFAKDYTLYINFSKYLSFIISH